MKFATVSSFLITGLLAFPSIVHAEPFEDLNGSYTSSETTFVTLKRLTFNRTKDGRLHIEGALVGFPSEVSIGEATGEPCAPSQNKEHPDTLLATFSSEKYKPFIVLTDINDKYVIFTCYMKDVDGRSVHFYGRLTKQP